MKFFKFLEANCLAISLFIFALFLPIFLFMIFVSCEFLSMNGSFNRAYQDSQMEAKELVGTWICDYDSTTFRFNEDNTAVMTVVFDEGNQLKEIFVWDLLGFAFRAKLLDHNEVDFFERRRVVEERVMNLTTNSVINEFVGSYEARLSNDKVEAVVVNWQEVDGDPISDAQIKLETYLVVHYEVSQQRNVLLSWHNEDLDCGFRLFHKAP